MKTSLKHGAGYLVIDHTNSPGVTPADVAHIPGAVSVGEGQTLERDFMTCSHCERVIVLNPLRTRDRGYCQKCHAYVCDGCEDIRAATGACVPMKQVLDHAATVAEKYVGQSDHPETAVLNDWTTLTQPDAPRVVLTDA